MAALSDAQIAGAAQAAGFSGSNLAKAVAIALAESRGNPNAHNTVPPDNSYGLWQINMIGSLGPTRRKMFGISSNNALFDPVTNAKAAYELSDGHNFRAWTTYTSGAYLRYLSRANKAAGNPSAPGVVQAGLSEVGSSISGFFDFISDPITWLRLGMLLAGGLLMAVALVQISGATGQAKKILNVLPQGRIAKAVSS